MNQVIPGGWAISEAEYRSPAPIDAAAEVKLGARTLTALYNEMPQLLRDAHDRLDRAVALAYVAATGTADWTDALTGEAALDLLLAAKLSMKAT